MESPGLSSPGRNVLMIVIVTVLVLLAGWPAEALALSNATRTQVDLPVRGSPEYLALFHDINKYHSHLLLRPLLPPAWLDAIPHEAQIYLKNFVSGFAMYYGTGLLWCIMIYGAARKQLFPEGYSIPTVPDMLKQIQVSSVAMPLYVLMPTIGELLAEKGYTRCYLRIDEVGWSQYLLHLAMYMAFVEFGVYIAHWSLHLKWAYKYLHATHHIYNKENTLSPFAGLAFNPLDGMTQSSPYLLGLFLVPLHFKSYLICLFGTAVWTTNIHDAIHGKVWPIMGAGYHTLHHTRYWYNYGQYTIFFDWLFGTLMHPQTKKD